MIDGDMEDRFYDMQADEAKRRVPMVKVKDAIVAFEHALTALKEMDPELPVFGNFDEGGYTDIGFPLKEIGFSVGGDGCVVEIMAQFIRGD